ncbi:efflux RND transporter periplasmic adaptor subunit [Vibrio cincinnatiensis]|uniref:efflux RND transporter periplasmic adaptor subunit n=1 Tax=Vibrio cincinnatiensis TaxID=675 RepID=UPI001EDF823E|nr:efflux RND transporter periplasmic adaptor subunit [Vibrio cincinnatiensis]MCG3725501.1 efflux RND transporter periplasmic adaptor subunit [Vibrio cincinnatiensis]
MRINKVTFGTTLLACAIFLGVMAYTHSQLSQMNEPKESGLLHDTAQPEHDPVVAVSVIDVNIGHYSAQVQGYGEAKPRYALNITAEVSGRVLTLGPGLESGQRVKKGEVLATLDQTKYQQAVSEAQSELATATLNLLEEERQGEQAKLEWQRSGLSGEPDSPLVLRQPQRDQAKAALTNAQKVLAKAQYDLKNTVIYAPFDGLVVSRDIQLGSYLQEGGQVATLYSTDVVEVVIPLSEAQWLNLPIRSNTELARHPQSWSVELRYRQMAWNGYVTRVEQHLDSNTRQRALVVTVAQPLDIEPPLYPGTFVTAIVDGTPLKQSWKLPQSAISQQGEIWYIDSQGQLASILAEKQFESGGFVYVKAFTHESVQIVQRPLSSYQVGTLVQVISEVAL